MNTEHTPVRMAARWVARHPRSIGSLTATEVTALYVGYQTVLVAAGVAVVAGASWRLLDRPTFDRFAGRLLRAWARRWMVYQRRWAKVMASCGLLTSDHQGNTLVPKIRRARSTWCWDTVQVRMATGQTAADFEAVIERLADAYKARRATVRLLKPGVISLDFQRFEPFDTLFVPLPELPTGGESVDLRRLVLGQDEYGRDFTLNLREGLHHLIAGSAGAGKAAWLWGLLRALAPLIREGTVRLWVIDPKGGMEFGAGREMFHAYADNEKDGLKLTRNYVHTLDARKESLGRAGVRKVEPSPEYPLDLLLCDELAAMTEYAPNDISNEFEKLISKGLTQFRAVGGVTVAAVQEPTKEIVPMRGLFTTTIALRLAESSYVDMALGEGVRDRGAFADQIPEYMPGVGYLKRDGQREPLRVRAAYTADDDITELVRFATSRDADVIDFPAASSNDDDADVLDGDGVEYIDADDDTDDNDDFDIA